MLKGKRLCETLDGFFKEHPEITPVYDLTGTKIVSINFPIESESTSFTNVCGEISIYYTYKGESIRFP